MTDTPTPRPPASDHPYHCPTHGWWSAVKESGCPNCIVEARERIRKLERELAEAKKLSSQRSDGWDKTLGHLAEKDAEIARLREDADRYKKIKTHPDHQFRISNQLGETVISCKIAVLDSVIDSVRKMK